MCFCNPGSKRASHRCRSHNMLFTRSTMPCTWSKISTLAGQADRSFCQHHALEHILSKAYVSEQLADLTTPHHCYPSCTEHAYKHTSGSLC